MGLMWGTYMLTPGNIEESPWAIFSQISLWKLPTDEAQQSLYRVCTAQTDQKTAYIQAQNPHRLSILFGELISL